MSCPDPHHRHARPEPTIRGWAAQVRPPAEVLDIAAGGGRHARLFADLGCDVVAVDRDVAALEGLALPRAEVVEADLEGGPWPFVDRRFDVVVVVNYLWRPLLPHLVAALRPGGLLMYDTFAVGNERFGRPRRPEFLLREGELRDLARSHDLELLDYHSGEVGEPAHAVRQWLLARAPATSRTPRPRTGD